MPSVRNYTALAPLYDRILAAGFDYVALGEFIAALIARFAPGPRSILELGAGTCPLARLQVFPPAAKIVYSDLSASMLALAQAGSAPLRAAVDATAIPFKARFDVCLMLMDACNYLLTDGQVSACLKGVFRVLRPGGIFVLNLAGETVVRECVDALRVSGEADGMAYDLESRFDRKSRILETDFAFVALAGGGGIRRERHRQRIHRRETIGTLALEAGFRIEGCFEGRGFETAGDDARDIHFVLTRPLL